MRCHQHATPAFLIALTHRDTRIFSPHGARLACRRHGTTRAIGCTGFSSLAPGQPLLSFSSYAALAAAARREHEAAMRRVGRPLNTHTRSICRRSSFSIGECAATVLSPGDDIAAIMDVSVTTRIFDAISATSRPCDSDVIFSIEPVVATKAYDDAADTTCVLSPRDRPTMPIDTNSSRPCHRAGIVTASMLCQRSPGCHAECVTSSVTSPPLTRQPGRRVPQALPLVAELLLRGRRIARYDRYRRMPSQ